MPLRVAIQVFLALPNPSLNMWPPTHPLGAPAPAFPFEVEGPKGLSCVLVSHSWSLQGLDGRPVEEKAGCILCVSRRPWGAR